MVPRQAVAAGCLAPLLPVADGQPATLATVRSSVLLSQSQLSSLLAPSVPQPLQMVDVRLALRRLGLAAGHCLQLLRPHHARVPNACTLRFLAPVVSTVYGMVILGSQDLSLLLRVT